MQKKGTYIRYTFYRYNLIGRKMSPYGSENVSLWVGKCLLMGLTNTDNIRTRDMPKRI